MDGKGIGSQLNPNQPRVPCLVVILAYNDEV